MQYLLDSRLFFIQLNVIKVLRKKMQTFDKEKVTIMRVQNKKIKPSDEKKIKKAVMTGLKSVLNEFAEEESMM